jgi:predicted transcriptional regulator
VVSKLLELCNRTFYGDFMGKNRDRLCIVADILQAAFSGANKTHIMFGANLSFKLLEKYLDVAMNANFLRIEGSRFVLTEQGREFLRQYKYFVERYAMAQQSLESLDGEREKLGLMCQVSKLSL